MECAYCGDKDVRHGRMTSKGLKCSFCISKDEFTRSFKTEEPRKKHRTMSEVKLDKKIRENLRAQKKKLRQELRESKKFKKEKKVSELAAEYF